MEYKKIYASYIEYANKCRETIKNTFFTEKDAKNITYYDDKLGINEIVKNHRLKMIDIKIEHTIRMIEQIIKINENLEIKIDLDLVIKIAVLYHDIGRIRQATWSNTYSDRIYNLTNQPFNNHGEDGYDIFLKHDFNVEEKYKPIISETILYHQNHHTQPKLNYKFDNDLKNIQIDDIITGKLELNDAEWQIASLIVQLVADVDKTDILYQQLSFDSDMIRDHVFDKSFDTLDNIAINWGISKKEIIDFNEIDELNYIPQRIRIPIKNVTIDKLTVPDYMKTMFYENSWSELPVLIQDKNWNFITILWWRLSHFLNQISFNSTLINIEESKLLEKIYERIPAELKPLFTEAFEYSKEILVTDRISQNKGNIYLSKKK